MHLITYNPGHRWFGVGRGRGRGWQYSHTVYVRKTVITSSNVTLMAPVLLYSTHSKINITAVKRNSYFCMNSMPRRTPTKNPPNANFCTGIGCWSTG